MDLLFSDQGLIYQLSQILGTSVYYRLFTAPSTVTLSTILRLSPKRHGLGTPGVADVERLHHPRRSRAFRLRHRAASQFHKRLWVAGERLRLLRNRFI